jgi:integrase
MPRSATVSIPHPSPRFRDTIRLRQGRRGPTDLLWCATFCVDGKWLTTKPISLGTTDFGEACEVARDKYAAMNGQGVEAVLRTYNSSEPKVAHRFADYADRAIVKLVAQAQAADAVAQGKGHNYRQIARRIRCDLVPQWGETEITKLTDDALRHWIEFEYRVEDRKATVALHGRQPRNAARQQVLVKPAANTLGNLDQALLYVWTEAVADQVVERRQRPMIDRSLGEDSEPRAFIDAAGLKAMAQVMTDAWVASDEGHSSDLKRLLRGYVALISATGIRPGMETKRVRLGDIHFEVQRGRPIIVVTVRARQAKHPQRRDVVVLESGTEFNVRRLLRELRTWRQSHGATDGDPLFAYPDGREPLFRDVLDTVLHKANAAIDPDTGEKRVGYSLRHYFATKLIEETDLSIPVIAAWMGTSSDMIERNYNRFILKRQAHRLTGVNPWSSMMSETGRTDPTILAQLSTLIRLDC